MSRLNGEPQGPGVPKQRWWLDVILLVLLGISVAGLVTDAAGHRWWSVIEDVAATSVFAAFLIMRRLFRRMQPNPLRGALIAAASRIRDDDEVWLDRDGHRFFQAARVATVLRLSVMNEDDFDIPEGKSGPVITTSYRAANWLGSVIRIQSGLVLENTDGEQPSGRQGPARVARAVWRNLMMFRKGMLTADAAEVQSLIDGLSRAELLAPRDAGSS